MNAARSVRQCISVSVAVGFVAVVTTCGGKETSAPPGPSNSQPTASRLAFAVHPTNVTAGASISPSVVVAVQDASGNTVATATHSVTVAIGTNPAGGTLAGATTVAAVSGVATFSNLSVNLAGTGYTLTVTATGLTGATSVAFNVTAAVPLFSFPSTIGTRWLYSDSSNGSFCDSYGCGSSARRDTTLLVLDSLLTVGGRSALQLRGFPLSGGSSVSTMYVSQGAAGLAKWNGSSWSTLLSATATSWKSGDCWSIGHGTTASVSAATGQVTVPAGSYSARYTTYSYQYSGQPYTQEFLQESCSDFYADGVGLVRSTHNYDYHDPTSTSSGQHGQVNLLGFSASAPAYSTESEPNDTTTTAQAVSLGAAGTVVEGSSAPADAAAIVALTLVNPDTAGVRRMQDWYRVSLTSGRKLTLTLQPEDVNADFDLYLFSGSPLAVVAVSSNAAGKRETISFTATSTGTFYIGVQNWNRKAGAHWYWFFAK